MKKSKANIEHRIQLKKIEIENYEQRIKNYPIDRLERCSKPHLQKLNNELKILENELEDIESKREIVRDLGYARIGRHNI